MSDDFTRETNRWLRQVDAQLRNRKHRVEWLYPAILRAHTDRQQRLAQKTLRGELWSPELRGMG